MMQTGLIPSGQTTINHLCLCSFLKGTTALQKIPCYNKKYDLLGAPFLPSVIKSNKVPHTHYGD